MFTLDEEIEEEIEEEVEEKDFIHIPISECQNITLKSYMVKELVKQAITATCLDSSVIPNELREFLLYNITFELSECEEETNEHEEEVNISEEKDNIDDQAEEENDVDNQTANLELSQIDIDQVAKRTSLIIEAPNSKIKKTLDWLIFCTERGHKFQDEYTIVNVVLNEDMDKRKKIITAFFGLRPYDYSDEVWRKVKENFNMSLLNLLRTDKHLKKYGVKIAAGTRVKAEENE